MRYVLSIHLILEELRGRAPASAGVYNNLHKHPSTTISLRGWLRRSIPFGRSTFARDPSKARPRSLSVVEWVWRA